MKKRIAILLCLSLLLAGCSGAEPENKDLPMETEPGVWDQRAAESVALQETAGQTIPATRMESVDLSAFSRENPYNKTAQVGVHAPAVTEAGIYSLDFIDVTLEEAFHALRPGDPSGLHRVDDHGYERLHSDSGMSLDMGKVYLSLGIQYEGEFQQRRQIFSEIEGLLQWKLDQGETESQDLPFASQRQVQQQCEKAMSALGIGLTPKLDSCIGITVGEARDYQQNLLKTDENYDCFGNVYELPELDDSFDCYYLSYSFQWDGIPVYGDEWFPFIARYDLSERYLRSTAQFLVSMDGIQDCNIYSAFKAPKLQSKQPVLSSEAAAKSACEQLDADLGTFTPDRDYRVEYVSFCLAPTFDKTTGSCQLTPIWGAETGFLAEKGWVYSYTGGEIFLDGVTGDRID